MIRDAVDSVKRFQGQVHDVIVASFGLSAPDVIAIEDEFLYDLDRFNVLGSRACTRTGILPLYPRKGRYFLLPVWLRIVTGSDVEEIYFATLA